MSHSFLFLGAFGLAQLREMGAFSREAANLDDKRRQSAQALGGNPPSLSLVLSEIKGITRAAKNYQVSTYAEKSNFWHLSRRRKTSQI